MKNIKLLNILASLFLLGLVCDANAGIPGGGGTVSPTIGTVPGGASSSSAMMNVTATITPSCTLSATPLNFGTVNLGGSGSVAASSNITFNCTKDTSYNINMDGGGSFDGANRYMLGTSGTDKLAYQISVSGANVPVNSSFLSGNGLGNASTIAVQGALLVGQNVPAGFYKDTVMISIIY
jgi:spore coat protein U-like protein